MIRVAEDQIDVTDEMVYLYESKPFTGISYELDDDVLISEISYKEGSLHGASKSWYSDGTPYTEEYYVDGGLHGMKIEWFKNGLKKSEACYEYGIVVKKNDWNSTGDLIKEYVLRETDPGYELLHLRRSNRN
ncbi:toxin-antitoxin system YwqK family antitoxin [Agaribacter marinus]|uniref:MORN repeat variant n=1 Tax=Agaribacter marinus TaxID=1431249 RepID=A0AA37WGP9_9ALTE|nr:hypothetical protein [Agaribacter marinus]GLR69182.1 hypothetical protein GCM10007852_00900 [Agaribacter marinus]